jgi:hypothetical protein
MGNKKRRKGDWVFFTCFQVDGLMRDLQNLMVERRRQGNKMGIKKERKQIWVFYTNFR